VNLYFILIIIVTMALILGPAAMLIPKPEQRRREQLRLKAHGLGLRFTMRKLPHLKTDLEPPRTMACYYPPPLEQKLSTQEWTLMRTTYAHEGNFYQEWDWVGDYRPASRILVYLQQQIPSLPDSIKALACGPAGISVFWSELEGEALLDRLVSLLKGIQAAENLDQG
jgi:hypothetical protein